jgi:hypothetical protein
MIHFPNAIINIYVLVVSFATTAAVFPCCTISVTVTVDTQPMNIVYTISIG